MASRPSSTPLHWLARAAAKIYFVAHAALALLLSFVTAGKSWNAAKALWREGGDSSVDSATWLKFAHQIWSAAPGFTPGQGPAAPRTDGNPRSNPGDPPAPPQEAKILPPKFSYGAYTIWPWGEGDQKLSVYLESMQEAEEICASAQQLHSLGVLREEITNLSDSTLKSFSSNIAFVKLLLEKPLPWKEVKDLKYWVDSDIEAGTRNLDQVRLLFDNHVSFETVKNLIRSPHKIDFLRQLQLAGYENALLTSPSTLQLLNCCSSCEGVKEKLDEQIARAPNPAGPTATPSQSTAPQSGQGSGQREQPAPSASQIGGLSRDQLQQRLREKNSPAAPAQSPAAPKQPASSTPPPQATSKPAQPAPAATPAPSLGEAKIVKEKDIFGKYTIWPWGDRGEKLLQNDKTLLCRITDDEEAEKLCGYAQGLHRLGVAQKLIAQLSKEQLKHLGLNLIPFNSLKELGWPLEAAPPEGRIYVSGGIGLLDLTGPQLTRLGTTCLSEVSALWKLVQVENGFMDLIQLREARIRELAADLPRLTRLARDPHRFPLDDLFSLAPVQLERLEVRAEQVGAILKKSTCGLQMIFILMQSNDTLRAFGIENADLATLRWVYEGR